MRQLQAGIVQFEISFLQGQILADNIAIYRKLAIFFDLQQTGMIFLDF
jgi:hypothetical protein